MTTSSLLRAPLARVRPATGTSPARGKALPYGSVSGYSRSSSSAGNSRGCGTPSVGLTIGGIGDHYAGYVGVGYGTSGARVRGGVRYLGGHHRRDLRYSYGGIPYYRHYSPIYYRGYRYYEPWYGYTYTPLYYDYPYTYRFYGTDVYYIDQAYESDGADTPLLSPLPGGTVGGFAAAADQEAADAPPVPSDTYPALTEPSDATLIGQGNAAFAAGRYDQARRLYVSAVLADERDGYAKFLYALANFAAGDYEVAGMAIRRALLTTPELIDYPVDVRSLYPHTSAFAAQLEQLIRFVDGHPRDRGASLLLGYLRYAGGEADRALSVLDGLVGSGPDDSVAALLRDAVLRVIRGK